MNAYSPDVWVAIKITSPQLSDIYKILAGWYGGYAGSDSWKINSGIVEVVDMGDYWEVIGSSGSVYECHKNAERLSGYTQSILTYFSGKIAENGEGFSMTQVDAAECFKQFIKEDGPDGKAADC